MPELNSNAPDPERVRTQVCLALEEDVGSGDLTAGLIPSSARSRSRVVCREDAVICGAPWFNEAFWQLDAAVQIDWKVADGDPVGAGAVLCELSGSARSLLTGERVALNYLQTLSGVATLASRYAQAVAGTGVRVLDTRKTVPGLRFQQKYAVLCGGCANHRMGLFDAILLKENHIAAAGSITAALQMASDLAPGTEVEVEVESLGELEEALRAGARRLLLDNFSIERLREAVALNRGRARLEASGNVSLETIRAIAETGVDDISVGALTKNVAAVDLSILAVS